MTNPVMGTGLELSFRLWTNTSISAYLTCIWPFFSYLTRLALDYFTICMVFAIEKLTFILYICRSTRNLTIFVTTRPNPTWPSDNHIDSYLTYLVSVHSLLSFPPKNFFWPLEIEMHFFKFLHVSALKEIMQFLLSDKHLLSMIKAWNPFLTISLLVWNTKNIWFSCMEMSVSFILPVNFATISESSLPPLWILRKSLPSLMSPRHLQAEQYWSDKLLAGPQQSPPSQSHPQLLFTSSHS